MKPIGAYKIASQIRSTGSSCLVVDHFESFSLDEILHLLDSVITDQTLFIGFSTSFFADISGDNGSTTPISEGVFFPHGKLVQDQVLQHIKKKNNNIKIVLGGNKVHFNYPTRQADFLILGFGEIAIVKLLDHLKNNSALDSLRNLYGAIVIDDRKALSYDIAQDSNFHWQKTDVLNEKVLPIELSRGCIFKCKFCSYPFTGKKTLEFVKSTEIIRQELQKNYDEFGVTDYYVLDDTFNDNLSKITQIHQAVQMLSFQPRFWAYVRLDLLASNPGTLKLLYEIGVRFFYFGIETLNERTGRIIGKGGSRAKQKQMLETIKKTYPDVRTHGSFIVGLPEESVSSVVQTIDELSSGSIALDSYGVKPLKIYDHNNRMWSSDIDVNYEKYGYEILCREGEKISATDASSGKVALTNLVDRDRHYPGYVWKNQHMDLYKANELADYAKMKSNTDSSLPFQWSRLSLLNYGYGFDDILKLTISDNFWNNIKQKRIDFLKNYKKMLFAELDTYKYEIKMRSGKNTVDTK